MKKLFALLLAVLMVISMAACAPAEPTGTTTEAPKNTTAATTTAATTTEAPKALNDLPFVEPGTAKVTFGIQTNATVLSYDDNYYTKYIEEKTGVDIEFVFFSSDKEEATKQLTLMVANQEKLPDAILGMYTTAMLNEHVEAEILVDLTDYLENSSYWLKEFMDVMTPEEKALVMSSITSSVDGKVHALPNAVVNRGIDSCGYIGGINRTMAEKFGMKAEEIDTVAEVYEFLKKAVNEDGNGNGKVDELGLFYRQGGYRGNAELWVINAYVHVHDNYMWNVTDGKFWSPLITDEYRQAMIELNKWYKEGLISPLSYSVASDAEQLAAIDTPDNYKVAIFGGHPTLVCSADSQIGLEYTNLPVLKAETDLGGYAPRIASYNVSTTSIGAVITTSAEDPLLTFRVLDFMYDDYTQQVARYGEEGVNWEFIDGEKEGLSNFLYDTWATYRVIKDEWSEQTKATWHHDPIAVNSINAIGNVQSFIGVYASATPESRNAISMGQLMAMNAGTEPEETMKALSLNAEEQEVYDTYRKAFRSFMFQTRAQFITGVRDPNSDADWDAYIKELEANGLYELEEAFQSAYTRLMG